MFGRFLTSAFSGYIAIGGAVVVLGLVVYIYKEGKQSCEKVVVEKYVEVLEERNKISNNRPDANRVIDRLRDGSF